jgi:hypothetical protein
MPPTPRARAERRIRGLRQIQYLLRAVSEDLSLDGDMKAAWWLDLAANYIASAEVILSKRVGDPGPASLNQPRESVAPRSLQPGSKEGI